MNEARFQYTNAQRWWGICANKPAQAFGWDFVMRLVLATALSQMKKSYILPTHTICGGDEMLRAHFCCTVQIWSQTAEEFTAVCRLHTSPYFTSMQNWWQLFFFTAFCSTNVHSDQTVSSEGTNMALNIQHLVSSVPTHESPSSPYSYFTTSFFTFTISCNHILNIVCLE